MEFILLSFLFHDDLDTFEKYYLVLIGLPCWLSWRRICLPMQKIWVRSLIQENPTSAEQLSPGTATNEP